MEDNGKGVVDKGDIHWPIVIFTALAVLAVLGHLAVNIAKVLQ